MAAREQGKAFASALRRVMSAGHLLLVLSIVLPLVLFVAAAWYARSAEIKVAHERVSAITTTLAGHAHATFQGVELLIARVSDKVADKSWDEIHNSREIHDFLVQLRQGLPQVELVFLVNPDGYIAASSRNFPIPPFDASKREYFMGAEQRHGIFVTALFRGNTDGTNAFAVSRSLFRNSAFDGVIAVTVSPGYFEKFYQTVLEFLRPFHRDARAPERCQPARPDAVQRQSAGTPAAQHGPVPRRCGRCAPGPICWDIAARRPPAPRCVRAARPIRASGQLQSRHAASCWPGGTSMS